MEADTSILLGIAEIAVAFAGFSALAGIVGGRVPGSIEHDFERLRTVVLISVLIVILSLVPIVLARFGFEPAATFRAASVVALLLNWLILFVVFRAGQRSGLHAADRLYTWIGYSLEVPAEIALLVNVFGLFPNYTPALYLAFLVISLCQAAVAFLLLLTSLFKTMPSE